MPFRTELVLRADIDDLNWTLVAPFVYERQAVEQTIEVPIGYKTDLASVPRLLWAVFPPHGKYRRAAVVHDYIYTNLCARYTREEADRIFYQACLECGVSKTVAAILWGAVRVGGRGNWPTLKPPGGGYQPASNSSGLRPPAAP